jgi:CUG-BP- and ETR3-like factor
MKSTHSKKKGADTEKERQARKAQKAQFQFSNMQLASLFGGLHMGYMPQYNGFGYQVNYALKQKV